MKQQITTASLTLALVAVACGGGEPVSVTRIGEPLPGLTEEQRQRFEEGMVLFNRVFSPEDGLGPLFNDNQCSACHTSPATGGTGDQFVTRMSRTLPDGTCDPLVAEGGENVRLRATPALQALGVDRQDAPAGATDTVRFNVPFVFGMGLIEAIPEREIRLREDPDDRDGDGISGRAGYSEDGRFARFGRMADQATLRDFIEHAALMEMGLTSPGRSRDAATEALVRALSSSYGDVAAHIDPAADPELSEQDIELLLDFMRFLAPPPRRIPDDASEQAMIARGEALFAQVGCTSCHVPTMRTGRSDIAALDRRTIALYSDLLLHDMGPELSGVCTSAASRTERRTEPLMGLGSRSTYLHDSRTNDLTEAILLHGGEATLVRERFRALPELDRHALIRFLQSL
ncbi:MAG: hypothetical protein GX539_07710 [Candidatus Cloacimonetes bacterium]|jgi:CxxC motif-containing protein (DUF1111 family)|nr:hypothetical protein [Candidatus Cloacimonadota bacterium]